MLAALLALLSASSGMLLVLLLWPCNPASGVKRLLQGSLSLGFGLGLFSIIFMLAGACDGKHLLIADLSVFAMLLAGCLYKRRRTPASNPVFLTNAKLDPNWLLFVLRIA